MKKPNDFARLLRTEDEQLQKLNTIVLKAIEEEKLVSEKLMEFNRSGSTMQGRLADWIAAFGGIRTEKKTGTGNGLLMII